MTALHVVMNGRVIGRVEGRGDRVRLRYEADLDPGVDAPLSLSMPLTQARHRGRPVSWWLRALLPDRERLLMRWRARFGITDLHPESLLAHIGEDVAGAAQFVREDRLAAVLTDPGGLTPLTDAEVAGLISAARMDALPHDATHGTGRFSLAGAQAKIALQRQAYGTWALPSGPEPSTHIFKPAIPGLEDQDVTEVATMRTAAELGLPTAHTFIAEFGGQRVIGVERYDRALAEGRWWRIHQEDLCQAGGLDPGRKYESQGGPGVRACADLLGQAAPGDVETFARAVIFNYLMRGSDAHARNYSLLITPGDVRLAPLYDLNSTLTFGAAAEATHLAMAVGGEDRLDEISVGNWRLFAAELTLPEEWVLGEVQTMATQIPDAVATVCAADDVRGVADATLATLNDRVGAWATRCSQRLTTTT